MSGGPARGTTHLILSGPAWHKRRAWAVASSRSASPTRPDYIFLFYKKLYIHIYNLYLILKTFEHDVLVRWLRPVSLALLPSARAFEFHLFHCFLIFYADLTKWSDSLTGRLRTVSRPAGVEVGYVEGTSVRLI